ncbi:hypothetical protein [Streptomyces diastatochromogenes]|uniref:hypothetical protein n=1 Tax=Streptomyces diastatochromogenes TaxID=42236 RepID=UPI00369D55C2
MAPTDKDPRALTKPLVIVTDEAQLVMDRASHSRQTARLTALVMTSHNGPRHYTQQER